MNQTLSGAQGVASHGLALLGMATCGTTHYDDVALCQAVIAPVPARGFFVLGAQKHITILFPSANQQFAAPSAALVALR